MQAATAVKADSVKSFLSVNLGPDALPWPILAVLLVGFFILTGLVILKASQFKSYATDFPSQTAPVVIGLAGFVAAMPVTLSRMALGLTEYDGTGNWLAACCAMAGVGGAMLGVKRFTSPEAYEGKAKVEAAKAAAAPSNVNVQGDATVNAQQPNVTAERAVPVLVPQAGIKPKDPAIIAAIEGAAKADPRLPSPLDDERD